MLKWFYSLPLSYVLLGTISVLIFWTIAYYRFALRGYGNGIKRFQHWKGFNYIVLISSLMLILYVTIFSRSDEIIKLVLQPFYSFKVAKSQPEMYRSMIMNIVLFFPLGLSFSSILSQSQTVTRRIITTSLLGLLLSLLIEAVQYFCKLGESWTDDVICNTLGAFIGSLTLVIWKVYFIKKHDYT